MTLKHGVNWYILGKFYGYPECCIQNFIIVQPEQRTENQKLAMKHGFVPCHNCADDIVKKNIKIDNLIVKRKASTPFPIPPSDVETIDFFIHKFNKKIVWEQK
jgi:hypothetical protein